MSKWFIASTALILFAIAAPAKADWFSSLSGGYSSPALTSAGGEVSVAVLTADGRERPGYGAADAVKFQGNSTNSVICRFTIVVFAAGQ